MATTTNAEHGATTAHNNTTNGTTDGDFEKATRHMTTEERSTAQSAARFGYGPLAHIRSGNNDGDGGLLPAFGGEFQPGLYKPVQGRKFANPAPLGLSAFALTTFVLSLLNIGVRGVTVPDIIISLAFGYGGLVQLLAGMWEMAVGNTFGATALSSYGGFWISFAIILTPGGFGIEADIEKAAGAAALLNSVGYYLMGWFIFTTLLLLCTLKSTVAFFLLFFTLDLAFLFLAIGYLQFDAAGPKTSMIKAGGWFGLIAAFLAWYNAMAGIADNSNSFIIIPVFHFPWSEKARAAKNPKADHLA